MPTERRRDVGGTVCAALFILLGVFALYDTTQMVDRDSYVFPRAIVGAMMVLSMVVIVGNLVRPGGAAKEHQPGSTARLVLLYYSYILHAAHSRLRIAFGGSVQRSLCRKDRIRVKRHLIGGGAAPPELDPRGTDQELRTA